MRGDASDGPKVMAAAPKVTTQRIISATASILDPTSTVSSQFSRPCKVPALRGIPPFSGNANRETVSETTPSPVTDKKELARVDVIPAEIGGWVIVDQYGDAMQDDGLPMIFDSYDDALDAIEENGWKRLD